MPRLSLDPLDKQAFRRMLPLYIDRLQLNTKDTPL